MLKKKLDLNIFHIQKKNKLIFHKHKFLSELNGCKDISDKNGATGETFLLIYSNRLIYFYFYSFSNIQYLTLY